MREPVVEIFVTILQGGGKTVCSNRFTEYGLRVIQSESELRMPRGYEFQEYVVEFRYHNYISNELFYFEYTQNSCFLSDALICPLKQQETNNYFSFI